MRNLNYETGIFNRASTLITVHCDAGGDLFELIRQEFEAIKILGVTVLTSLNLLDLLDIGYDPEKSLDDIRCALGQYAVEHGAHGLVCGASFLPKFQEEFGVAEGFEPKLAVCPAIRWPEEEAIGLNDQKQVSTPQYAKENGATHIVVGRPIVKDDDPAAATV